MPIHRSLLLFFVLTSTLLALACGGREGTDSTAKPVTTPKLAAPAEKAPAAAAATDVSPLDQALARFPADTPALETAALTDARTGQAGGARQSLESTDPPEDAASFYRREYLGQGWSVVQDKNFGGMTLLTFERDGREVSVAVQPGEGGGSQIEIIAIK